MKLELLQAKLMEAARTDIPSDRVPYAFEKRILARVAGLRPEDGWVLWARALWRATIPCAALMVLLIGWSIVSSSPAPDQTAQVNPDLGQALETTLLASVDTETETLW